MQRVADKFNIPRYSFNTSAAIHTATFLYFPTLAAQGRLPVENSKLSELVQIPGVESPLHFGDLSPTVYTSNSWMFEQMVYGNAQSTLESDGVLMNTFYEMEPSCIDILTSYPYPCQSSLKVNATTPPSICEKRSNVIPLVLTLLFPSKVSSVPLLLKPTWFSTSPILRLLPLSLPCQKDISRRK